MRHVVEIDKLQSVAIFDAVLRAHVLMLMMKVLAIFGEPHCGKSLLVERVVITAAQVAIQPENQQWLNADVITPAHLGDISRHLPRSRVTLATQAANAPQFLLCRCRRNSFRKYSH